MSICWSNHRIRDSSIIESHLWLSQRITVVSIMSTNSACNFTWDHTRSAVFSLSGAYSNRFLLPTHPWYRSKIQREPALRSALVILHTACPDNIRIIMQFHIFGCVSQSMRDCAPKISQKILGTNPVRLNQIWAHHANCKTYVWTEVHQEHQCGWVYETQRHFPNLVRHHYHITSKS